LDDIFVYIRNAIPPGFKPPPLSAIIPVHLFGQVVPMEELGKIDPGLTSFINVNDEAILRRPGESPPSGGGSWMISPWEL
jgi:hypothetical protein